MRARRPRARRRPEPNSAAVRRALLAWYRAKRRDLPWRRTRDPYAIWVAETMLQQTRVETVVPYYERFLDRFPSVEALATADRDAVLGLWAGLGYYSRARNLQAAAREVWTRHAGRLPDCVSELQTLPGVGRYTAGAVASIAFDRPAPVVDGNVARVLCRLLRIEKPLESAPVRARLWEEAERFVRGRHPGDWNQALMELGARVCTPRAPRCPTCPVRAHCRAHAAGEAEALPRRAPKRPPRAARAVAALVQRRGRALAVRRPPSGLLGGLWELPGGELDRGERPEEALARALRERVGIEAERCEAAGVVDHAFSHRRLELHVFRVDRPRGRVRLSGYDAHRWLAPGSLGTLPLGTVTRKALAAALSG